MLEVLLILVVCALFVAYGNLCYKQGLEKGYDTGSLLGIFDSLRFLAKKKLIGFDENASIIFRIRDDGGRGEAIDIPKEKSN